MSGKTRSLDNLLSLLKSVKKMGNGSYIALCPGHPDTKPSLSVKESDGKILLKCFAGCELADILRPLNLEPGDLFLDNHDRPESKKKDLVATFSYEYEKGKEAYQIRRFELGNGNKTFEAWHRRDGTYVKGMGEYRGKPILYHLPEIPEWIRAGKRIYLPEGEGKADRIIDNGGAASTAPFGGGRNKWRPEYSREFAGAEVVVLPDNDKPGRDLAQDKATSLYGIARSVKVLEGLELPEKGDIIDWFNGGGTFERLEQLADACPDYELPPDIKTKQGFNWQDFAISHDDLLGKELPPVDYLVEDLLTTPGTAVLAGRKKIGKSWLSLQLSQCIASGAPFLAKTTRQGEVIYLSLEDGERRLKQRLELQNATKGLPVTYIGKFQPLNTKAGFEALQELIKVKNPVLVVIDTLASAKNRFLDENEAGSTADLFNQLHELAMTQYCVILVIAHHGKQSHGDVGFDIRGSSAISGATDTNLGLYKNADGTFDLKAEGRDIGEVDLRISFDTEVTWCWQCKGDARDVRRAEAEDRILEAIALLGGEADATAIANEIGIARPTVSTHLKRMREQRTVDFRTVRTGKASKIIYTYPTDPTNLQPVAQSLGSVGSVVDTKNKGIGMLTPLTDGDTARLSGIPCVKGEGTCDLRTDAGKPYQCAPQFKPPDCQFWRPP